MYKGPEAGGTMGEVRDWKKTNVVGPSKVRRKVG
jgi:hypothetical protein